MRPRGGGPWAVASLAPCSAAEGKSLPPPPAPRLWSLFLSIVQGGSSPGAQSLLLCMGTRLFKA